MKAMGKFLGRLILGLGFFATALWAFGPYEPSDLSVRFDETALDAGVDSYLAAREARVADITAGVEKQVIWADAPETRTAWSVVYLHGFSATAQEIRPVPDRVAGALGANLVFTRLQGHGRTGDAMAEGTVAGWMGDTAEALAIGRRIGERVLVISTSTGGTLAAAAALNPSLAQQVAGVVMISPNFAVNNPMAGLLTWPAARYWIPLIAGKRRSVEPRNAQQARYWSTDYPSVAVLPMAALVKAVGRADLGAARAPALFIFSDDDRVVVPAATHAAIAEWGGPVTDWTPALSDADDPSRHVIAGDIVSPDQTGPVAERIIDWARGL